MIFDFQYFKKNLPKKARILGIDLGEKTIGLALSDDTMSIATPFTLISRKNINTDIAKILEIIKDFSIKAVVIGYPLNMNGTKGPSCARIDQFIKNFEIPFLLWDERFSTVAVERTLLEANMSRDKRKSHIDKLAAAYILQGALDRLKSFVIDEEL
jgi:putative Holliday junction resolvase